MSCPNCGAQLEIPNQRFCQDCGRKLPDFPKSSELPQKYSTSQEAREIYQLQEKTGKIPSSRPLSKTSLGFGIVSIIIAVTTFNLGSSFLIEPFILPLSVRQILIVSFGILNVVGTLLGFISKIFNLKAKKSEYLNTAMKAGSVLGIIGIIINSILMIVAFTLVGFFVI
ncbi:MAG: hypothetical protein ACFE8G_12690 [Candidatus Hermodarchaeota archaeon]